MADISEMPLTDENVICPRCGVNSYTPYGEGRATEEAPYPALSRLDNKTYICSWCGLHEALLDMAGESPIPPDEWPIVPMKGGPDAKTTTEHGTSR